MENRFFLLISRVQNYLRLYIKKELMSYGINVTPVQLAILFLLEKNSKLSMSDLSNKLQIDNSAITRTIDRLEKLKFVKRILNSNDRREYFIEITNNGKMEAKKAKPIIKKINQNIESQFNKNDFKIFKQVLNKFNDILINELHNNN